MLRKHSHYFKDVSKLKTVDVYRLIELFDVTHPCLQHAIKKLLVAGGRGAKNVETDIQEAIDTLVRYLEMRQEDAGRRAMDNPNQLLDDLVKALDSTNWSSWQTTAAFEKQLDAAREYVDKLKENEDGT